MASKKGPPRSVDQFQEAVDWFREKVPITKDQWLELDTMAREKSFTVANVAQLDVIADVQAAVDKAIADGESLDAFRGRVSEILTNAWGEDRPWHVETIFRTNVQLAYSRGRDEQQRDPDILDARPYWLFSALLDSRTSAICRPLHGTLLPASDRWWLTHTPPLHFNCRSLKRSLTREQAVELGVTEEAPDHPAADGFGSQEPLDWVPDLSKYPRELVKRYRRKR